MEGRAWNVTGVQERWGHAHPITSHIHFLIFTAWLGFAEGQQVRCEVFGTRDEVGQDHGMVPAIPWDLPARETLSGD